jgi:hypothetical protein
LFIVLFTYLLFLTIYFFLGSLGGVLFEHYVLLHGKSTVASELEKALLNKDNAYDAQETFIQYRARFWFYAATTLYQVNQKCSFLLMHLAMQLEYRGLSRNGRALASHFGLMPSIRNYEEQKNKLSGEYVKNVRRMIKSNEGILTFDNYCHVYGSPTLSLDRTTAYEKANYTVVALCKYDFKERPSFRWKQVDEKTAWASLPRDPTDLLL